MDFQLFRQLSGNPQRRIEGRHGVLEHHSHVLAADTVEFARLQRQHVLALQQCLAAGVAVLGEQAHDAEEGLALAGSGFTDDRDALAAPDRRFMLETAFTSPSGVAKVIE